MMRIVIVMVFVVSVCINAKAQYNSDYVQYMYNGLLINPAYAGSQGALNITGLYRKQWLGIEGAPVNSSLTFHMPLKKRKISLGAMFINDHFGVYDHTRVDLVYAYCIPFLRGRLSFGLQGGMDSRSTNWGKISIQDPGDPNFVPQASRNSAIKAQAGTYYVSENFYSGLSVSNLIRENANTFVITTLNAGGIVELGEKFRAKPSVLFKYMRSVPLSSNASLTLYYKDILGLGVGYTHKNAAAFYTDIKVNGQLNLGYAYSRMINSLSRFNIGSHEIMLRYLFCYKINAKSVRYF